jgi:hypothetical protein
LNKKKKKKKANKEKNKGKKGLGKIASMTGTARLLQRHPRVISCILGSHSTRMSGHPLATSPRYMAWKKPLGNFPFLMDASPIGYLVLFLNLVL